MPRNHESGFWGDRFKSGVVDAATFSFLGARMHGLSNRGAASLVDELPLGSRILSGVKIGGRSGLEAGLLHAQLDANIDGKLFNSPTAYLYDGTGFAAFGALAGGAEGALRRPADVATVRQIEQPVNPPGQALAKATEGPANRGGVAPSQRAEAVSTEPVPGTAATEKVIKFSPKNKVGGGDEGTVYSNGDGTVTKVFHKDDVDVHAIKSMFDRLRNLGLNLPEIREVGKAPNGKPAIKLQEIGDGDNLQHQLVFGSIPKSEMVQLRDQYYAAADILNQHGLRIDWNLKNMRWEWGKLWILDPSFLKQEPMGDWIVQHMGRGFGPRPQE